MVAFFVGPGSRDDKGASHLGKQQCAGTDAAAGAEDQHRIANLDFAAGEHHSMGGPVSDRQARSIVKGDIVWKCDQLFRLNNDKFGVRPPQGVADHPHLPILVSNRVHQNAVPDTPVADVVCDLRDHARAIAPGYSWERNLYTRHALTSEHVVVIQ